MQIPFYFDYACPWAYLGSCRVEAYFAAAYSQVLDVTDPAVVVFPTVRFTDVCAIGTAIVSRAPPPSRAGSSTCATWASCCLE